MKEGTWEDVVQVLVCCLAMFAERWGASLPRAGLDPRKGLQQEGPCPAWGGWKKQGTNDTPLLLEKILGTWSKATYFSTALWGHAMSPEQASEMYP